MRARSQRTPVPLSQLIAQFGGELVGADIVVSQVANFELAEADDISFVAHEKYLAAAEASAAGALVVGTSWRGMVTKPHIVAAQPYLYFARIAALFNPPFAAHPGIHPSAIIASSAHIEPSAQIGPLVSIADGASIGAHTLIEAGCRIGPHAVIGEGAHLYPNVVIYHDCIIGNRSIIHSGAVIGADGFGNAWDGANWVKIPQIGRVVIGEDVEIGASTTIDRGALGDTVIEDGVRLDNQIQIGHNCHIGRHTAMAGCVGVAGSTKIGAYCTFGGSAMILGHLDIVDRVNVMAGTLVGKSILQPGTYVGQYPVQTHADWLANASHLRRLDALAKKVKELEKKLTARSAQDGQGNGDVEA